ncbi:hypothetical protein T10_4832 [Trichinella papuae]|uniref:Uncharacterized protein n=1 Tax=Trichinella papuae TaxID=268474 RepID=A0A0V1MWA8_9BILA|nr:hypothetical protein T10_4832 [Trichinella papuae]
MCEWHVNHKDNMDFMIVMNFEMNHSFQSVFLWFQKSVAISSYMSHCTTMSPLPVDEAVAGSHLISLSEFDMPKYFSS